MVPFCEHHPAALGERQLQRLLGVLRERGAVCLRAAAFQRPGHYEVFGDGALCVCTTTPLSVSGSCSGSWKS
jgi:hypothetical protein